MTGRFAQLVAELGVCMSRGGTLVDRGRLVRDTARFHIGNHLGHHPDLAHPRDYRFRVASRVPNIQMRSGGGDFFVLHEVFASHVYAIPDVWKPGIRTILDLGAHVGLTALYLLESLPNARIVCVEAAADNARLLRHNLSGFTDRATVVEAAIGPRSGRVSFAAAGWSWQRGVCSTDSDGAIDIRCASIDEIMRDHDLETVDLLKMDVEGMEAELFEQPAPWLEKVRTIIIELHPPYSVRQFSQRMAHAGLRVITPSDGLGNRMIVATRQPIDADGEL